MSRNISICGVRDLDRKFALMAAVLEACDKAEIPYPPEVKEYFQYPSEGAEYNRTEMEEMQLGDAIKLVPTDWADVWEIDVSKLSPEVKKIRVKFS